MKVKGIQVSKGAAKIVEYNLDRPKRTEVLIETKVCGICSGDAYVFQGKLPGGRVLGHEGAGVVAEVGEEVKNVAPGDKVTTLGGQAFAEFYKTVFRNVAKVPESVQDLSYWISEPATCVVNGIRGSAIEIGDNVCLIGCGYMGLLLLQAMPKTYVGNLFALDVRDERLELAKRFGAEHAVNSAKVNPVETVRNILQSEADVVIEASGAPRTLYLATDLVRKGGKLVIFGRHVIDEKVPTEIWHSNGIKVLNTAPNSSLNFNKDFHDAVRLLAKGVFDQKPLVTHKFPWENPEKALKTASEKPTDYIKGVITF